MFDVHKIGETIVNLVHEGETDGHKLLEAVLPHVVTVVKGVEGLAASPVASYVERIIGLPAVSQTAVADALNPIVTELERLEGVTAPQPAAEPAPAAPAAEGGQVDPPPVEIPSGDTGVTPPQQF